MSKARLARCPRCRVIPERCLCAELPRLSTRTQILILRHAAERKKPSNTARIAQLCLEACRVVDYGLPGRGFSEPGLAEPASWLLYPDASGVRPEGGPPCQLVVLDGTWSQTRRMLHRIEELRGMPRLSLEPPSASSIVRLRQARRPCEMATLEAIARALEILEGPAVGNALLDVFAMFVARARIRPRPFTRIPSFP